MFDAENLDRVSSILAAGPAWARPALTSADERVRARGADELSAFLVRRIAESSVKADDSQLSLPIPVWGGSRCRDPNGGWGRGA